MITALGLAACLASVFLPWRDGDFRLAGWARLIMAAAGGALLLVVARWPGGEGRSILRLVAWLGICVLIYPTLLGLAAAGLGGSVLSMVAAGWHTIPLLLVQLAPVVASSRVLRRRTRGWESTIVVLAVISTITTVLVLVDAPGATLWLAASTATFLASFAIGPIATWLAVARTRGETRRRSLLAAVAALIPVVIIVGCTALGAVAGPAGSDADLSVTVLLLGFSVGALLCGVTVVATTLPPGSALLRTRVLVALLDGLAAAVFVIMALVVGLALPTGDIAPGWTLLAGGAAVAALLVPWLRLRGWIARVVDPADELRHELALAGEVVEGQQRNIILLVLRRLVDDPDLALLFRVDNDTWVNGHGTSQAAPGTGVVLATRAGDRGVVALASNDDAAARVTALGDVTPLLQPALLEASAAFEAARVERAAEQERQQLERDLHDGLQGRLLGLALHLQLSGRDVDDPSARLLLAETVAGLRSTVDDVRALGGGRQPELLARAGLAPALDALFRHARPLVELDIPAQRFPAETETTVYFVVGEAVTNALKHAAARQVRVCVRAVAAGMSVTVTDDGRGGADPRLGSGLRGLAERVAATGGAFVVRDQQPSGTVVEVVVPCGS